MQKSRSPPDIQHSHTAARQVVSTHQLKAKGSSADMQNLRVARRRRRTNALETKGVGECCSRRDYKYAARDTGLGVPHAKSAQAPRE